MALKLTSSARKASTRFYKSSKVFSFVLSFHCQITDLWVVDYLTWVGHVARMGEEKGGV